MINRYKEFVNEEVGLRNLKKIIDGHKTCEIYFHKDLDGVASAICMKQFLKTYYDIDCVDAHIIQYGGLEFAVKNGEPGTLKVLVDFAHSKPMFHIASDHHDKQVGAEDTAATYFKSARSNVETISGEISYSDMFTPQDIEMIKTIDSANFTKAVNPFIEYDLKPEDIQNAIFKLDTRLSGAKNRFMMGLVVNRLLLAYKNKRISVSSIDGSKDHINKNILECMVLDCSPSLYSMFSTIKHYVTSARVSDKAGVLAQPEELAKNLSAYIDRMKDYKFIEPAAGGEPVAFDPDNYRHKQLVSSGSKVMKGVHFDEQYKIIMQYGGGYMVKPGSYDRYVPFKNYPEADFICIVWPMGLVQVSCNPFKEKKLKNINLGEIAKEVMAKHELTLSKILVSLEHIKYEYETSQDWKKMAKEEGPDYSGVGFRFSDLNAFYKDCVFKKENGSFEKVQIDNDPKIKEYMDIVHGELSDDQKEFLKQYKISVWELMIRNSGGHPSITNVQGFGFLKYNKEALRAAYGTEKYTDMMKKFAREFVNNLKEKIDADRTGKEVIYNTAGVDFKGQDTNETYDFYLIKNGSEEQVSKKEFVDAGSVKAMKPNLKKDLTIDSENKKIIAKFENFVNRR